MQKIGIIGGGASGLLTAIYAKTKTNQVIIFERNSICAKKVSITGNGKCNYWNEDQDLQHYHTIDSYLLPSIISKQNQEEILTFFQEIGITPKIKNGYYYPFSNQAVSIQYALILEAQLKGIIIETNCFVKQIEKKANQFIIQTEQRDIIVDCLVLATGSKACPKTGSDGIGYDFAKKLGHSIIPVRPALVSLIGEGNYFKKWSGIRTEVALQLYEDGKMIKKECGEIQLTDYGISGICVFNLSRYIAIGLEKNKKEIVYINFLPFLTSKNECKKWIDEQTKRVKNRTLSQLLEATLHYQLVSILLKQAHIEANKKWNQCSQEEQNQFIDVVFSFPLQIKETNSYIKAQVCSGGIPLTEINPITMESIKQKNLYIVGELLDVDGDCGGYNLGFAWMTGMIAGKDIRNHDSNSTN